MGDEPGQDDAGPSEEHSGSGGAGREEGRKKSGTIYRRGVQVSGKGAGNSRKGNARAFKAIGSFAGGQAHRAVRTPDGPRAHSGFGPSRGLKTYTNAVRKASVTVPKAAHDEFVKAIGSVIH
jgi:hypothetical protein